MKDLKVKDDSLLSLDRGLDLLENWGFKRVVRDAGYGFGDYAARKWDGYHVTVFLMTANPEEDDDSQDVSVVRGGVTFVNPGEVPIDSVEFKGAPSEEQLSSVLDYIKTDTQTLSFEEAKEKIKSYVLATSVADSRRRRGVCDGAQEGASSLFEECVAAAVDIIPGTIEYAWIEDDHTDCIRFWLAGTQEVYSMLWLSDMRDVEEFTNVLQAKVDTLESYLPIARTPEEQLTYDDVYGGLRSELGVSWKGVSLDDYRMWWDTELYDGHNLTFMAEGNDLDGDNFKITEALEEDCGLRAVTALAGVSGILVRLSRGGLAGESLGVWYLSNPTRSELQRVLICIEGVEALKGEDAVPILEASFAKMGVFKE